MNDETVQRLAEQVQRQAMEIAELRNRLSRLDGPLSPIFPAKLAGDGTWVERSVVDGELVDSPDGRACDSASHTSKAIAPPAGDVFLAAVQDAGGVVRYVQVAGGGGTFPVRVEKDGGDPGNREIKCTFTYTVKDIGGATTLATQVALTGVGGRIVNCAMVEGTRGIAGRDQFGNLILLWVDETAVQNNCS